MSSALGDPILVPGPYGLWMLGHTTPFGVQTSIENFRDLAEGRDFCLQKRMRMDIEIDCVRITYRQAAIIVAAFRDVTSIKGMSLLIGTSIAAIRRCVDQLTSEGLVFSTDDKVVGSRTVTLTDAGLHLAKRLEAEGL